MAAGVGIAAGSGAFWLGRGSGRGAVASALPTLVVWARELATGERSALVRSAPTFLLTIEEFGGDPVLWNGVTQLLDHTRAATTSQEDRDRLEQRILATLEVRGAELPANLLAQRAALRKQYPNTNTRR